MKWWSGEPAAYLETVLDRQQLLIGLVPHCHVGTLVPLEVPDYAGALLVVVPCAVPAEQWYGNDLGGFLGQLPLLSLHVGEALSAH